LSEHDYAEQKNAIRQVMRRALDRKDSETQSD